MFPIFLAVSRVTCGGGEPVPVLCVRVELRDTPAQPCSSLLTTVTTSVSSTEVALGDNITETHPLPRSPDLQVSRSLGLQTFRSLGL